MLSVEGVPFVAVIPSYRPTSYSMRFTSSVGVEQQRQFQHFRECHTVHVEWLFTEDGNLVHGKHVLDGPGVLCQSQQFLVARLAIGPEDALDGHDVAPADNAFGQVLRGEVQVMPLQRLWYALVSVMLILGLLGAEEYLHGPRDAHQRGVA